MRVTNCNSIMAMKTKCGFAVFFSALLLFACSGGAAAQDGNGFEGARHKTVRTMFGFGRQDVLDTYLSPLIYKGFDLRFVRDIRRSAARNGRIMLDNSFDIDASMPENKSGYREYALLFNWNYRCLVRSMDCLIMKCLRRAAGMGWCVSLLFTIVRQ